MLRRNVVVEEIRGQQQRPNEKNRFEEVRLFRMSGQDDAMAAALDVDCVPYGGEHFVDEAGAGTA